MPLKFFDRFKKRPKTNAEIIEEWERKGKPAPPPHAIKQKAIKYYKSISGYDILVETGTFRGDMVEAQSKNFKQIFSIELGEDLWKKAVERFKLQDHITILQGDSGKVLGDVVRQLRSPAIFWLDGHYSAGETAKGDKDCPIFEEIDAIFSNNKMDHILLVDDARCFIGKGDYPTVETLTAYIKSKDDNYTAKVKDDIICYSIKN